jgi:cathepsin F
MSKTIIKILLLVVLFSMSISQATEEDKILQLFIKFIKDYDKNYPSLKIMMERLEVFKQNLSNIDIDGEDNIPNTEDDESYSNGITQFSDLTDEEFQNLYLNSQTDIPSDLEIDYFDATKDFSETVNQEGNFLTNSTETTGRNLQSGQIIPASWDWRTHGAVTSVKNQGICGSCWAFATTANIEGQYYRKYQQLVNFSEQQLVDCDSGSNGCNGGSVFTALKYIMIAGGLQTRASYPYLTRKSYCRYRPTLAKARVEKYLRADKNENAIKEMLYSVGPITATMNGNPLKNYRGGVFDSSMYQCNPNLSNHIVTLVGYGTTPNGKPYWIAKNSWGPSWGENGYFRIAMGKGVCGINNFALTAILK